MTTIRSNLLSESRLLQSFHHRLPSTQRFPVHVACRPIIAAGHLRSRRHPVIRCECGAIQTPFHAIRTLSNWLINRVPAMVIHMVPARMTHVIERKGEYLRTLDPGIHFLTPFVDKIAYVHSMRNRQIPIEGQYAPTKDNVNIMIEGSIHMKIVDPVRASYAKKDLIYHVKLAQSTEVKTFTLQQVFEERNTLKENIMISINEVAKDCGFKCLGYEIENIYPPDEVTRTMEMQFITEQKNIEDDHKKMIKILEAIGDGQADLIRADVNRDFIAMLSDLKGEGCVEAACLRMADQYIEGIGIIGQAGVTDPLISMICQAMQQLPGGSKT